MKKTIIFIFSVLFFTASSMGQRYAVIDSKFILDKMPEYKEAQTKLDQFSKIGRAHV